MGRRRITFFPAGCDVYEPDGRQIVLTGGDKGVDLFTESPGAEGFGLAPITVIEDSTPGVDGSRYSSTVRLPRTVSYRFYLRAKTKDRLIAAVDRLYAAMDTGAPGVLLVESHLQQDEGTARFLRCSYVDGLPGDPALALAMAGRTKHWEFGLTFRAFDPSWYSLEPATARWVGRGGERLFTKTWTNSRPFRVDPTGVVNTERLLLGGGRESYGTFVLGVPIPIAAAPGQSYAGPWRRVRFTNRRTGQWWEIGRETDLTETLIVRTDPKTTPSVRNLAGQNRMGFTYGSTLFALAPGDEMDVTADGITSETAFEVSVPQAWRSE